MTKTVGSARTVSIEGTALALAALALSPGQSVAFGSGPPWTSTLQIQWQCATLHYSDQLGNAQVVGKPASGQSGIWTHYNYDEAADLWTLASTTTFSSGGGHLWSHAYDPATGDYYVHVGHRTNIERWDYATQQWVQSANEATYMNGLGNSSAGGMGWHPNLFGPGDGGVVVRATNYAACWRRLDDTWQAAAGPYGSAASPHWGHTTGGDSAYLSGADELVVGTGVDNFANGNPLQRFSAGAGGLVNGSPATTPDTPLEVFGAGTGGTVAKIVIDPNDPAAMLMLDRSSPSTVRRSTDKGQTWASTGYTHPFRSMGGGNLEQWTCGAIPKYGVIWGLSSGHDDGIAASMLWRPND